MLIDELLNDDYDSLLTAQLQSGPTERRFSQYRQMSGRRILVSLREVLNTEQILCCRSLIKKDINFWKEELQPESNEDRDRIEEILESVLDGDSSDVATTISRYIAKKLLKQSKDCEFCYQHHLDWGVMFASQIVVINKNKRKTVFVKTQWRSLKPINGVNNLFYNTFIWFYII